MNNRFIPFAIYQQDSRLIVHVNLNDYGQGWKELEIPTRRRKSILHELDVKITRYRNDSNYRKNIGPGENVDMWIQDIVKYGGRD